jgi:hypothetical protein
MICTALFSTMFNIIRPDKRPRSDIEQGDIDNTPSEKKHCTYTQSTKKCRTCDCDITSSKDM